MVGKIEGKDDDASGDWGISSKYWDIGGGQSIQTLIDKIEESQNQSGGLQAGGGKRRMCRTEVCWPEISSYRRVFFNLSRWVTENSEPTHFCNPPPTPSSSNFCIQAPVYLSLTCTNPPESWGVWQLNKLSLFGERWRIFNFTNSCTFWWMSRSGSDSQMQKPPRPHFKRAASLWCPCHIISVSEGAAAELIKSWAFARSVAPVLLCESECLLLGCLTSPWKAYQLVSPGFASGCIIHERLFLNESNQNVVGKRICIAFQWSPLADCHLSLQKPSVE